VISSLAMLARLPNSHHMVVPTAAELDALPRLQLVQWCYQTARYGLVTQELVHFLHEVIGGRTALEVGAGVGDLGYALGIPMTDSAIQTDPVMRMFYVFGGQAPTNPPPDVERIDAEQALAKYKPQVIVASWLTQKFQEGDDTKRIQSSVYGADEVALIHGCETYIFIGNEGPHGDKRILALPHDTYAFPWLWSRAKAPQLNRIWVWSRAARQGIEP
jgi:hypothetical protein